MSFAAPLINAIGEDAYLLPRVLGARSAVTGISAVTYTGDFDPDDFECDDFECATSIKIIMNLSQVSRTEMSAGAVTNESQRGYVAGSVDVSYMSIIEYHGVQYVVDTIEVPEYHLGEAGYKQLTLIRVDA